MSIPAFCRTCPTKRPRTRKDPGSIIYPPENDSLETVPALDCVAAAAELFGEEALETALDGEDAETEAELAQAGAEPVE